MAKSRSSAVVPSPDWRVPALVWDEIISRYVTFLQVPGWRASVKSDGSEKRTCVTASEATVLGKKMLQTLDRVMARRFRSRGGRKATIGHLIHIAEQQGSHISR